MAVMLVTLEVSKLSDWLNADAYCRESKGGHAARGEVYVLGGGRRRTTAVQAACRRGLDYTDWGQGTGGGAHVEHLAHGGDAGGVEGERLVERRRALPRVERRAVVWGELHGSAGGRRRATATQAACRGGLDCRFGAGHGEERT